MLRITPAAVSRVRFVPFRGMGASCAKVEKDSSALIIPSWEELPLEDEGLEAAGSRDVKERIDSSCRTRLCALTKFPKALLCLCGCGIRAAVGFKGLS